MPSFAFLPILLLLALGASAKAICNVGESPACNCFFDGHFSVVKCTRLDLKTLPQPEDVSAAKRVDVLDVSYNDIERLEFTARDAKLNTLRVLYAAYNYIATLSGTFLAAVPHLTHLDLSHNVISTLEPHTFANVPSLHYLDLSFNQLEDVPDGALMPVRNLRYLDLSYNEIGAQLATYKSLNASGLGFNDNLETLKLNAMNLATIRNGFFENMSLKHLEVCDNNLKEIPILPESLTTLDLSGNLFATIEPRYLFYPKLQQLFLNRLPLLENVTSYAFYNLRTLQVLEIEHCPKLKVFNDHAFGNLLDDADMWNLTRISLNGNALRGLNDSFYYLLHKIGQVDLSSNPWICDCQVTWLRLIRSNLVQTHNTRCVAPRRLRNHVVADLTDKLLPKCNIASNLRTQKILTSVICILVVLLLCLIMYLIYLAPFKGNRTQRFIGDESPYNARNENNYFTEVN